MKKYFLVVFIFFALISVSCNVEEKIAVSIENPEFATSEEALIKNIGMEVDSFSLKSTQVFNSELFSSLSRNKLRLEIYRATEEAGIEKVQSDRVFRQVKRNLKDELLNKEAYDIFEIVIFNKNRKGEKSQVAVYFFPVKNLL